MKHELSNEELELFIQRCVDGELSEEQHHDLIRHLDNLQTHSGWRLLAIAFMEEQIFACVFRDQPQPTSRLADTEKLEHHQPQLQTSKPDKRDSLRYSGLMVTTALGLLLGLSFNGIQFAPREGQVAVEEMSAIPTSSDTETQPVRNSQAFSETLLPSQTSRTPQNRAQTPIRVVNESYPYPNDLILPGMESLEVPATEMFYDEPMLPPEVRRHLESLGYAIERRARAYRVPLENGREVIVPSETIRVRYANDR